MMTSESCANVVGAFQKALAEVAGVTKGKTATVPMKSGGKFTYTYADLADVLGTIKDASTKHGISVSQNLRTENGSLFCDTMILHESGEWLIFPGMAMPADRDAQANGSAATYMRRYTLCAVFALEVEDDDGKAAGPGRQQQAPKQQRQQRQAEPEAPPPPGDDAPETPAQELMRILKGSDAATRQAVKDYAKAQGKGYTLADFEADADWRMELRGFLVDRAAGGSG